MSDHDAFLQAILERPDDDAPRLMYSDWLSERGDPRGEFIRVQIELTKTSRTVKTGNVCPVCGGKGRWRSGVGFEHEKICWHFDEDWNNGSTKPFSWEPGEDIENPTYKALRKRERELFSSVFGGGDNFLDVEKRMLSSPEGLIAFVRRGFVDEIYLTTEDFLQHAKAIFKAQPITKIRLTDAIEEQDGRFWVCYNHIIKMGELWFDSLEEARQYVSDRCVEHGRKKAGLPVPELEVKRA